MKIKDQVTGLAYDYTNSHVQVVIDDDKIFIGRVVGKDDLKSDLYVYFQYQFAGPGKYVRLAGPGFITVKREQVYPISNEHFTRIAQNMLF